MVLEEIDKLIKLDNGDFAIDLLPYKTKNRNLFYDKDHPVGLNPHSLQYKKYWQDNILRHCLEGKWVYDKKDGEKEGTWVFTMPKLFFYLNYTKIVDDDRNQISPRLMDMVWLMAIYSFCAEGFSGFEDDEDYTCHKIVEKTEEVGEDKLSFLEKKTLSLATFIKKENGDYKKYINPWLYLTETYLITDNRNKPLGQALYENGYYNEMILASRTLGKSFWTFMGNFYHEFLFGSIRRFKDKDLVNNAALFGIGSSKSKALSRSIANLSRAYSSMPGQFDFPGKKKDTSVHYNGPFYKKIRGTWTTSQSGSDVTHLIKAKSGTSVLEGSIAQIMIMKATDSQIGAGDRFRMIIVEECGFSKNLKEIHAANKDSLSRGDTIVGKAVYIGTGGHMEFIKDSKDLFENPEAYNIFSIPNLWAKKKNTRCGLFLGKIYQTEALKDKQGNTYIRKALEHVIKGRIEDKAKKDSVSFGTEIMFNPIYPRELLRPSHKSPIPVVEISDWMHELMSGVESGSSIFQKRSNVGYFRYGVNGVEFKADRDELLTPIILWGKDEDLDNKAGAWILYEDVMENPPQGLYYILYDPVAQSGEGTSLQSILVYKHMFTNGDNSEQDTIVASFLGRNEILGQGDRNYEEAIKAANYFNGKIFSENNAMGYAEYVLRKELLHLNLATPYNAIALANGGSIPKMNYTFGMKNNQKMNGWSINKVADWLLKPVITDENGLVLKRNYQNIYDPRLLSELINFNMDNKSDFDAVSALMLLPFILSDLENVSVEIPLEEDDDPWERYDDRHNTFTRPISKFNKY